MANPLPPSDAVFNQLSGSILHYAFEVLVNQKDKRSRNILVLLVIVILAYAGVEAVKLIFRNGFGKKGIHHGKAVLSFVAFVGLSYVGYDYYSDYGERAIEFGSQSSFLAMSIFYSILALTVLFKWVVFLRKNPNERTVDKNYRGDSSVLSFLLESGWNQAKIQNVAEPLLVLVVGALLSSINLYLGAPLIFCALSVWIHLGYETLRGFLNIRNELSNNKGHIPYQGRSFSEVG